MQATTINNSDHAAKLQNKFKFAALCFAVMTLAACSTTGTNTADNKGEIAPFKQALLNEKDSSSDAQDYKSMYAAVTDGGQNIPALDLSKIDNKLLRKQVNYKSSHPVGTVIVDPFKRYLYLIQPNNKAMRYSVGVGRAGLEFDGEADLARKAQWPRWTPTASMIKRNPEHYAKYAKGVEGGIRNPMGARALYLHRNGQDTLYRIHGTNEPWSIGKAASSGCIRLFNQDIIDLHKRIKPGGKVIVLNAEQSRKGEV